MRIASCATVAVCLVGALVCPQPATAQLPLEPGKKTGQNVTAAYEGWYRNEDGSFTFLIGYFNRNHAQALDIPIGPDNRIEPGGPDRGQPTHFLPRRAWGVFTIRVPADFGNDKLTWHLVANGVPTEIPFTLKKDWEVEPLRDAAQGNTPPTLRFEDGTTQQGPPEGISTELRAVAGEPLELVAWATDDDVVDEYRRARAPDPPARVFWSKYRGPGAVEFEEERPEVSKEDGRTATHVTFAEPGDYVLRLQANDVTGNGGGGAQCCWTNAHVRVDVAPGPASSR